jgi:hypothetical protein
MPPVAFEPTISAGERPQTYVLDRAATGTGNYEADTVIKYTKTADSLNYVTTRCQLQGLRWGGDIELARLLT